MSLLIKGVTRLSELIIDADKDWQGHVITGLGEPAADSDAARKMETRAELYDADPSPGAERAGELIRVRAGAGSKSYVKVCVQNSAGNWEWIQIGIST